MKLDVLMKGEGGVSPNKIICPCWCEGGPMGNGSYCCLYCPNPITEMCLHGICTPP